MNIPARATIILFCATLSILLGSCARVPLREDDIQNSRLVIAVWDGPIAQRIKQFATIYSERTGIQVAVNSYPEWQFGNLVEAKLLAGTAPWDVVYLKGEWVPELIEDRALKDMKGLLTPEQAQRLAIPELSNETALFGLAVDGSLPFLFYRKDQISPEELGSFQTSMGYLENAGQLRLPAGEYPSGAALGELNVYRELLSYNPYFAHSHISKVQPSSVDKNSLKTELDMFCKAGTTPLFHPDSIRWGEAGLAQALQDGKIASAVLWAKPDLIPLDCAKGSPTCLNGASLIGFQLFPSRIERETGVPRLMNAWTVPGQDWHASKAAGWIQWVVSAEGEKNWLDLGGIPLGNDYPLAVDGDGLSIAGLVQTNFFDANPAIGQPGSESLEVKFTGYFNECIRGRLSPDDFLVKYSQDVSAYLKQRDLEP